jgi:hypothetical protein
MPASILIPFAVFFACCAGQFWFLKQVRDRLIECHPDKFLEIEKSSIFPQNGIRRFTRRGRYKALGDEELNRRVRNLKRLFAIALIAWAAFGIALLTVPLR